jgi:uncharacterized cupredoxin-like copper-binding protein
MRLDRNVGGQTAPLMLLAVPLLTALAIGCGASGAPATRVSLVARDIAYEPTRLVATVGEPVEIAMQNVGAIDHDLNVDGIAVRDVQARDATTGGHGHPAKMPALHVAASPGKTATVRFVPTAAGTFEVWCSVAGHREAGLVAVLEVREARS